jgi:hypothetical protein
MRKTRLFLLSGFILGLAMSFLNCGGNKCDAKNCATGCCDTKGVCQAGTSSAACGASGASCAVCASPAVCAQKACTGTGGAGGGTGGAGGGGGAGGNSADAGAGTSCANAIPITLPMDFNNPPTGAITTAGQVLWYKFDAAANDFLVIFTQTPGPNDSAGMLDTAVTLWDSTGATRIASDDDAFPRASMDSELFHRVKTATTYCLSVEDWSSWSGTGAVAPTPPDTTFTLFIGTLDPNAATNNFDVEPNDDAGVAQTTKMKSYTLTDGGAFGGYGFVYGGLDTASDVDVFRFTAPVNTKWTVTVPPTGPTPVDPSVNSYGSTTARFGVKVTNLAGTVLSALNFASPADDKVLSIEVPVVGGQDYLLWMQRPAGGTLGANDFYVSPFDFNVENKPELETTAGSNDTIATAEVPVMRTSTTNSKVKIINLMGYLTPAATDVDYFSFPATAGDKLELFCYAVRTGSGLLSPTFAIFPATGAALQTETETANADVAWWTDATTGNTGSKSDVAIGTTGNYYLKVSATGQDSTNTGNYYRCDLALTSP